MPKMYALDVAIRVVHKALQFLGGYGYMTEYPLECLYHDVDITPIYEGTRAKNAPPTTIPDLCRHMAEFNHPGDEVIQALPNAFNGTAELSFMRSTSVNQQSGTHLTPAR